MCGRSGQPGLGEGGSFTSNACNYDTGKGSSTANDLCFPTGVALDGWGNLYVADHDNNRVLEFNSPLTNTTANTVFGQGGSFTTNVVNNGGLTANSLQEPSGVALDALGNLYVADWATTGCWSSSHR